MVTSLFSHRTLAACAVVPMLLTACSAPAERAAAPSSAEVNAAESASVTPLSGPLMPPTAPAPPACGTGAALLATMSTRDKLAQTLMVGVRNAADARAVVGTHHVGGIMIGSWTDLSMLSDGTMNEISNLGPLPLAVSVDEEGGFCFHENHAKAGDAVDLRLDMDVIVAVSSAPKWNSTGSTDGLTSAMPLGQAITVSTLAKVLPSFSVFVTWICAFAPRMQDTSKARASSFVSRLHRIASTSWRRRAFSFRLMV
jgi:hypothetical protein